MSVQRIANQYKHSVQLMLKDYAKWIPNADLGSKLATVIEALEIGLASAKNTVRFKPSRARSSAGQKMKKAPSRSPTWGLLSWRKRRDSNTP